MIFIIFGHNTSNRCIPLNFHIILKINVLTINRLFENVFSSQILMIISKVVRVLFYSNMCSSVFRIWSTTLDARLPS